MINDKQKRRYCQSLEIVSNMILIKCSPWIEIHSLVAKVVMNVIFQAEEQGTVS